MGTYRKLIAISKVEKIYNATTAPWQIPLRKMLYRCKNNENKEEYWEVGYCTVSLDPSKYSYKEYFRTEDVMYAREKYKNLERYYMGYK
jgi:hypothetical protein